MNLKVMLVLASTAIAPGSAMASGTDAFDKAMEPILKDYLAIQHALARESIKGVKHAANNIVGAAKDLDPAGVTGEHAEHYKGLPVKLAKAAAATAAAMNIIEARDAFKALSKPMAMWGTMSKPKGVVVMYCSMAKAGWLQRDGAVQNPYYGSKMPGCGEVVGGNTGETGHTDHHQMQHGEHMNH